MKNESFVIDYEAYKVYLPICATVTKMTCQNLAPPLNGRGKEENIYSNTENLSF